MNNINVWKFRKKFNPRVFHEHETAHLFVQAFSSYCTMLSCRKEITKPNERRNHIKQEQNSREIVLHFIFFELTM